jgi:hypothetical protein
MYSVESQFSFAQCNGSGTGDAGFIDVWMGWDDPAEKSLIS